MSLNCTIRERLARPLAVGPIAYRNRVVLAPMSGVTDVPFRRLAWEGGAGMVVSEMVASEAWSTGMEEMRLKAEGAGLPVHVVQIAGREARWMAEAARLAEGAGANVVDINMGCPARKVVNGWSGSALMRDLDHALTLIDATVAATRLPVTLKMRLGWDDDTINAPELASRAEHAGVRLLTVHGRTRCQFYKGRADWRPVSRVRAATRLPLVVNGDIAGVEDAEAALAASGADAVMVGRASYGAPWLAGEIVGSGEAPADLGPYVARHHGELLELYGTKVGVRAARKHLGWYAARCGMDAERRAALGALMRENDAPTASRMVRDVFGGLSPGETQPERLAA